MFRMNEVFVKGSSASSPPFSDSFKEAENKRSIVLVSDWRAGLQ